jgi:RNA polymerase sigma-54 factor
LLELRTAVAATLEQTPTVNCQLIVRSELLELPYLALCARIKQEAEENPALEVELEPPAAEQLSQLGWHEESVPPFTQGASSWTDPTLRAPAQYTLRDDLRWRLACVADPGQRRIADYLVENIDDRGYLAVTVFDAALELQVSEQEVAAALEGLQGLAPPGVGARDLRECLLLQLEARRTETSAAHEPPHVRELITHCAESVERGGWRRLGRSLGLEEEQLAGALQFIRDNLHPYPGEQFHPAWHHLVPDSPHVTQPDAVVFAQSGPQSPQGDFKIEVAAARHMRVHLSDAYRRLDEGMRALNIRAGDEATKQARAQVRAARQLIWSLDQRNRSLYRITKAVVEAQSDFLREGALALKPLTHKQIAEKVGLHESTVSRAIAGKLLLLPSGAVAPYSLFFDDALPAKTVIKSLIHAESPEAPLTDEQLQGLLADRGFELARRTVTKYRLALGMPSSTQRRRRSGI